MPVHYAQIFHARSFCCSNNLGVANEEYVGAFDLIRQVKDILQMGFGPQAFNFGVNCGEAAGQMVFHAHIHIIPRYRGDIANPRRGVRNIIPGKGNY